MWLPLAKENYDRSPLVDLKKEALSIARLIKGFEVSKINRQANEVAHGIVKFISDTRSDGVLVNSF